ncbi:alginate O-acetyltransferase AlgX-related protein [Maribacter sp. LLG6340-A2]|uniref:alginate O-acetyltransferase AlgX-related protein n=1 Tax=Maribacter sp. LLG6340-A2 TaxID=3160834 RepID=UPI00386BE90C
MFLGVLFSIFKINQHYFFNEYEPEQLFIDVEFKASEDDIFQLFYRDSLSELKEKFSQNIRVKGSDNFQRITYTIPDTLKLEQVRFDFGNKLKLSPIEIKHFLLKYNGNSIDLAKDSLTTVLKPNQYTTEISKNVFSRKVIGKRSDPFMLSISLGAIIHELKQGTNKSKFFLIAITSLILAISLIVALRQLSFSRTFNLEQNQIFVVVFLGLLSLSFLDNVFSLDNTKITEKRELASKPELTTNGINQYPSKFENYFNDHFGFRNKIISLGGIVKAKLFNTSPKIEKVMVGNDDWLFFWEKTIQNSYLNSNPFATQDLGKLGKKLMIINAYSKESGTRFITTIYPNKHTVYGHKIPNRFKALKNNAEERIDQFYRFVKSNKISNVDNRNILKTKVKNTQLYFKNDSHWNSNGAYYAYKNIFNLVANEDRDILKPLLLDDFSITIDSEYLKGDLINLLGIDNKNGYFKDDYYSYKTKKPNKIHRKNGSFGKRSLIFDNPNSGNEKVAVVFGDSFSNGILQFIPYHFKKTIFIRNINMDIALIKTIKPDYVIFGMVERNLELF